jgi:hypothetical protein
MFCESHEYYIEAHVLPSCSVFGVGEQEEEEDGRAGMDRRKQTSPTTADGA